MGIDIGKMTLKEKIGQVLVVGFHGCDYDECENLKSLIEEYKLGNVILFSRNVKDVKQLHDLTTRIHEEIIANTNIMPFIGIDQEGGMVTRIMKEATFCPGNMTLGATNPNYAKRIGEIMGEELRALGINMNYAPSLDVNNNPNNPVIGVRSYSDDPKKVAIFGRNYIEGLQSKGVIATAKHFPGHGDTNVDSHLGLPIILHDKERLEQIELVPFIENLDSVKAIMSAHILFKAYEKDELPGTLSKKVLTDLLRKKLGYKGLIISDCMEMKAIDDKYGASNGALMGLLAGLDQAMISQTYSKQVEAFRIIEEAVINGILPESLLDEKVERVLKYKESVAGIMDEFFFDKSIEEKMAVVLNQEHKDFALKVVDESFTLVRGKTIDYSKKLLVLATEPFATTIAEDELSDRSIISAIKELGTNPNLSYQKIAVDLSDKDIDDIINKARFFDQVLVCTFNATRYKNQAKLVNKLYHSVNNLFVLSTRSPYDIHNFECVENYCCLYEYTPNSVKTIVKYLNGEISPRKGNLPINLNKPITIGASIYVGLDEYPLKSNLEYLKQLKKNNVEKVFISAHMPEMNKGFIKELTTICDKANELGIKIILDVSKPMISEFEIPNIYALRLDYGFTRDEIIEMYNASDRKYLIELNASTISENDLLYYYNHKVDLSKVRISHNFYPKEYTGLTYEEVERRNKIFKSYGMNIMMYIPSSNQKRPPMYEGLPTIEEDRYLPLEAILSSARFLQVDEIFFGDSYVSPEELDIAINFNYDSIIIPIELTTNISDNEKHLLEKTHYNRIDMGKYFIRSSCRSESVINVHSTTSRLKKMVTIDNVLFARYQGEVCIMLEDLPSDHRINVVGKALCSDYLLSKVLPGKKFKLLIKNNKN